MKTSTAIVIGVVALAGVGGLLYWQHEKTVKAVAAAKKSAPKSTADKIVGTVSAAVPLLGAITSLWA